MIRIITQAALDLDLTLIVCDVQAQSPAPQKCWTTPGRQGGSSRLSLSFRRIFFLLIVLTAARAAAQTPEKSAPNVVLITIDTLRADHVGCYGYQQIETPNIDSLATDGARFARAFTSLPASFVRQHAINLTHRWRVLFVD